MQLVANTGRMFSVVKFRPSRKYILPVLILKFCSNNEILANLDSKNKTEIK